MIQALEPSTASIFQVDVVMSSPGSSASPFDFLARFAGPIAWLIAGLLLLFGGLCLGRSAQRAAAGRYAVLPRGDSS